MKFIFWPFFGYIIKFLHVAWKITNPSHDDIYMRIFVKIFSEGRRQDFSSGHKVFPNQPKKISMLQMTTSIWEFLYIFSRKDVGRKKFHFLPTSIGGKWFNFNLKDVSRMSQSVIGTSPAPRAPPMCRPPFFQVVKKKVKWSQKVPLNLLKIGQRVAYR